MFSCKILRCLLLLSCVLPFEVAAAVVVENGLSHVHQTEANGTYSGNIQIANTGEDPVTVKIYVRDYQFDASGSASYDRPGSHLRSNAGWLETNVTLIEVAPRQSHRVEYTIRVPEGDFDGTYWSVVMVEGITQPEAIPGAFVNINTVIRYAVQIATDFGNAPANLVFDRARVARDSVSGYWFHVAVNNTGETRLEPELSLEVFDKSGASLGVYRLRKRKTYPGTSVLGSFHLRDIEAGVYPALLLADCGDGEVFGVNVDVKLE